ncbi:hypothetical protein JOF48_000512 [Arthrobacter stackebrandtii]|uniref:Adenylate cyclase n=1 Tax=Arthrobacter stackebrandtii TaxID=272161 RepID=A0ABS4YSE7_9MICC|nr:hypothetical protein [Arthrobacter stackebrandtii]MBP2411713.1 hypothetical protein [Arthrobacter stackebrandtii]
MDVLGTAWVYVVAGVFVLVVAVLGVLLLVGRFSKSGAGGVETPPEVVPHPRGEAIPPTGSR